jgi:hypothetical protein
MITRLPRVIWSLMLFAFPIMLSACGSDGTTQTNPLAGTYRATLFRVMPTGQPAIDVISNGGSLTILIAADNSTSGALMLPANVTGSVVSSSMAGSAVITGTTVRFEQTADTFVRNLIWTVSVNSLQVNDQTAGAASFTITLTRQ